MGSRGRCHAFAYDFMNAPCGPVSVELHLSAEKETSVEISKQQVGVRYRRLLTAQIIARWSRIGFCAFRTDLEQSNFVGMRDAAAAGPNLDHVDRGCLQRKAASFLEPMDTRHLKMIVVDCGLAVIDDT